MHPGLNRSLSRSLVLKLATAGLAALSLTAASLVPGGPGGPSVARAAEPPLVTVGSLTFRATPYEIRTLRPDELPYTSPVAVSLFDQMPHDSLGVRIHVDGGVLYYHPVALAQYALQLLDGFRLTSDSQYLNRALLQIQTLLDVSVKSGDALFFPYLADFPLHGNRALTMKAPWYSAMAQGLALSAFVRAYEATGDVKWRLAADEAFRSYLKLASAGDPGAPGNPGASPDPGAPGGSAAPVESAAPWTTLVTGDGYLWFEEYASSAPDYTFNGHLFAVFGLFDYYRLTGSGDALQVLRGGLTSAIHEWSAVRNPGWISFYCDAHHVTSAHYHQVHVQQLLWAYAITGDAAFARRADVLNADYPPPEVSAMLVLPAGSLTGYRFDASGAMYGKRLYTSPTRSSVFVDRRARIKGRAGYYLRVTEGRLAGYWVRETATLHLQGAVARVDYDPPRVVSLAAVPVTGVKLAANGSVAEVRTFLIALPTTVAATAQASIDGRSYLAIASGEAAGYWVPVSKAAALR